MKSFSKLNENNINTYKYTIQVTMEGNVSAEDEGQAGELVDNMIDEMDGVTNYQMVQLDEVAMGVTESIDNDKLLNDKLPEETISENLLKSINGEIENLNESQKEFIIKQLKNNL